MQTIITKLEIEVALKNGHITELENDKLKLVDGMTDNIYKSEELQENITKLQSERDIQSREKDELMNNYAEIRKTVDTLNEQLLACESSPGKNESLSF